MSMSADRTAKLAAILRHLWELRSQLGLGRLQFGLGDLVLADLGDHVAVGSKRTLATGDRHESACRKQDAEVSNHREDSFPGLLTKRS